MPNKISLSCPKCGNTTFKTDSKFSSSNKFNGATCSKCGTKIDRDYPAQIVKKEIDKMFRDAFKGSKFFKFK
ncbi:ECs_2282 family putative zinc-binding protein [Basfia succiniciproducens]|uniref:ECs_2282 family putative zinc-binding protein n=1 Tax=Basfia succiniciproducens TaxID=653940 RepID=UPI003FCDFB7A